MLISLVLVALAGLVLATPLLFLTGHRIRRGGPLRAIPVVLLGALAAGEAASRILGLPTTHVLVAETALAVVGVAMAVLRRRWNAVGVLFFTTLVTAAASYLALGVSLTFTGGLSLPVAIASLVMLVLETAALALACLYAFETCDVACRTAPDRPTPPFDPAHLPFVSLHVAAYNEPPDMLIETIQSLEGLDYPHFEIVVIDNNTVDEDVWRPVERYCADRERITFVHVAPWPGFKSGALNHVLAEHMDPRTELIGVIDADYVVEPEYLRNTVGHFVDENLGFLQTPQDYREWEGDTYLTACYDAYRYFFVSTMPSRDNRNSIIFTGTMGLIRRDVLEEVGGWAEWCITEDAELALRVLRAGYSGRFLPTSYGHGIMPLTFSALKRQYFRWCFGGLQMVRHHWRSLMPWNRSPQNHLRLPQRADYLLGGLQWFGSFLTLAFTLVFALSAFIVLSGQRVAFRPFAGPTLLLPIVLGATSTFRAVWALRHLGNISLRRALLAMANWLALSWPIGLACAKIFVSGKGVFLRTPKWKGDRSFGEALRATKVESTLAGSVLVLAGLMAASDHGGTLLPGIALSQAVIFSTAPMMAWLNLRTELSARLERRQRTEERRERLTTLAPHFARAGAGLAALGVVALFVVGGTDSGERRSLEVPRRAANDDGPLGNLGILPDASTSSEEDADPDGTGDIGPDGEVTPTSALDGPEGTTTTAPAGGVTTLAPITTTTTGGTTSSTSSTTSASTTSSSTTTSSTTTTSSSTTTPPSATSTSASPPTSAAPPTSERPGRP